MLIEDTTPFSGMRVGKNELQMVSGISLVRAGQLEPEVLLSLSEFFCFGFFL